MLTSLPTCALLFVRKRPLQKPFFGSAMATRASWAPGHKSSCLRVFAGSGQVILCCLRSFETSRARNKKRLCRTRVFIFFWLVSVWWRWLFGHLPFKQSQARSNRIKPSQQRRAGFLERLPQQSFIRHRANNALPSVCLMGPVSLGFREMHNVYLCAKRRIRVGFPSTLFRRPSIISSGPEWAGTRSKQGVAYDLHCSRIWITKQERLWSDGLTLLGGPGHPNQSIETTYLVAGGRPLTYSLPAALRFALGETTEFVNCHVVCPVILVSHLSAPGRPIIPIGCLH